MTNKKLVLEWEEEGNKKTLEISDHDLIRIGRDADCQIVLEAPTVSRISAEIKFIDGSFLLTNLSKTNPIRFYEEKLNINESKRVQEKNNFKIGTTTFSIIKIILPLYKVRCITCRRAVDGRLQDCPWDGTSLSSAATIS